MKVAKTVSPDRSSVRTQETELHNSIISLNDKYDDNIDSIAPTVKGPGRHCHCLSLAYNTPPLSYEAATWFIFLCFTALAIVDRFTTNVWPRQVFTIGGGSAGTDRLEGFKPGPWSVVVYDVLARVSGRFCICCFNLLLITRLRSLEYALSSTWVAKYVLDCTNIINANLRLHKWNAIALCVLTVIHVWSILHPCVTDGYSAQVVPGSFEYPLSERTPKGFKDADPETETMSLQVDDIWRMVEMTLLLCVLTPISVKWLSTRWHVGMPLHRLIMILYFVDIVRRHSHPHSWVLNTPVFVIWLLDKVYSRFAHRSTSPKIYRVKLDEDYMALFWKHNPKYIQNKTTATNIGPDYSLLLNDSSLLEDRHVFSAFENRIGMSLIENPEFEWSVGTIIRVFRNKRAPRLGRKDPVSHTMRMYDAKVLNLTAWGPSQGEMSSHVYHALQQDIAPVVLIAAGSGCGYAIDALQWAINQHYRCKLHIIFTTRSSSLHEWVKHFAADIIHLHTDCDNFANDQEKAHLQVSLALTGMPEAKSSVLDIEGLDDEDDGIISTMYGRVDFRSVINRGSVVFFQGGRSLKNHIAAVCKANYATFFGGLGGS